MKTSDRLESLKLERLKNLAEKASGQETSGLSDTMETIRILEMPGLGRKLLQARDRREWNPAPAGLVETIEHADCRFVLQGPLAGMESAWKDGKRIVFLRDPQDGTFLVLSVEDV